MGAAALLIGGTVLGAVGQISQGISARNQANFQAQIAKNNEIIANRKAADARLIGSQKARQAAIATNQLIGAQRGAAAASGVQVDFGSALDLNVDAAGFGRLDELRERNIAERQALGFEAQADVFGAQADALEIAGDQAFLQGVLGAGATTLTGAVDPKWFNFGQSTTPAFQQPGFRPPSNFASGA
jgi:hypothetical protein